MSTPTSPASPPRQTGSATAADAEQTRPDEQRVERRAALTETTLRGVILTGFLLLIVAYFATRSPGFLTLDNGLNILVNASVIGIVSLGQALTIISGGFDLSVSGTVPLGSVVFAIVVNAGWSVSTAVLAVLAVGAVVGLVNGVIVAKANINPLIATLGTLSIAGGLALTIANGIQIPFIELDDGVLAEQSLFGVNNHVWILVGLSVLVFLVLRYTVFGRYLYSVGGNREAARLAGIPVDAVTMTVYVVSAALASLAGAVLASQLLTGSGSAGTDSALQSIAAVIAGASLSGGVGGVPGTLIGCFVLGTLANGMAILSVQAFYQTIATGFVLLLAVGISQIRQVFRRTG